MVYLAILLILCGLLILITALSVETGIVTVAGELKSARKNTSGSADSESEDVEIIYPGDMIDRLKNNIDKEDIFISFDDESAEDSADLNQSEEIPEKDYNEREFSDSRNTPQDEKSSWEERRKLDSTGRLAIIEKRENHFSYTGENEESVSAVMFDDRSNIIDYESGTGVIDSTFSKYKSIKRLGKGKIESDYDGVNFYLDEKLYRFDFHKVYDIWSGPNYIALPLKGNSTVKLFIIENSAGFPGKVEANFKEYEKGL